MQHQHLLQAATSSPGSRTLTGGLPSSTLAGGGGLPSTLSGVGGGALAGGGPTSSLTGGGLGSTLTGGGGGPTSSLTGGGLGSTLTGGGGGGGNLPIIKPRQLSQEESLQLHKKLLLEGRDFEKVFLQSLLLPGNQVSIKVLKAMATSLKNRLDVAKAAITPGAEESPVQNMFPSFISNPYISWASLVVMIEQLDGELTKLETALKKQETTISSTTNHSTILNAATSGTTTTPPMSSMSAASVGLGNNNNNNNTDKTITSLVDANDSSKEGEGGAAVTAPLSSSSNSVPLKKRKRLHVEERTGEENSNNNSNAKEGGSDGSGGGITNGVDDSATAVAPPPRGDDNDKNDLLAQIKRNKMLQAAVGATANNPILSMESLGLGRAGLAGMDMTTAGTVMGHHGSLRHTAMNPYFAASLAGLGLGGPPGSAGSLANNPSAGVAALAGVAAGGGGIPPELKQQSLMSGVGGSDLSNMSMVMAAEAEKKRYPSSAEMQLPKMSSSAGRTGINATTTIASASTSTSAIPKPTSKQPSNNKKMASSLSSSSASDAHQQPKTPPSASASSSSDANLRLLPMDFCPSINEVVIGRGKKVTNHCGNVRFRELIYSEIREYSEAMTKAAKSSIIVRVLQKVKNGSPETGGFVKQDLKTERWFAVEDALARITTAQAFRDALSSNYKSSKQFKQQSRWDQKSTTSPPSSTTGGAPSSSSLPRPP